MTEYAPLFPEGPYTSTASADITAGQVLVASGNDTVAPSGGASIAYAGIAAFDAKSGETVTVLNGGVHILGASGSIAAGAVVTTAASGKVADIAAGTTYDQAIGVALSAAASNLVKVRLFR
ncbi:capsid cement protein [Mycobacterium malmoense]|uniref:capsid cement protein n=1 Tax=Mycobacterium malmoense TaxID=1780 RepID=UPI0008F9435A|nr:capsid cement protein [Mycobacterium malmoense]OIN79340.1 hypothetical protein BMG05_18305 [Mycobacterium malmoense]